MLKFTSRTPFLSGNFPIPSEEMARSMKRLSAVTIFAVAMGYLEAAVVIYIREMISGSQIQVFPIHFLGNAFALIEIGRELATIIMLGVIGCLAGISRLQRWMYFVFSFAVWDLAYYMFLQLLTGWPGSLLAYDVLFLIPVVWIGPVLAPVLVSLVLGTTSIIVIRICDYSADVALGRVNLGLFVGGCVLIILSFTRQIFHILMTDGPKGIEGYSPKEFDWILFSIGFTLMTFASVRFVTEVHQKMIQNKVDQ